MSTPNHDLARWQGKTEARVHDTERRLDGLDGQLERVGYALSKLDRTVAALTARVAVAAAIAALIGSGLMTVAVYFITRG